MTTLRLAAIFFVIALIAALFGFGFAANFSLEGARVVFFIFAVLTVLSLMGKGRVQKAGFLELILLLCGRLAHLARPFSWPFRLRWDRKLLMGRGEDSLLRLPRSRGAVFPGGRVAKASFCGLREDCLRIASFTSVNEPASNME